MITLACLDMAGTTVRDDGVVLSAFAEALAAAGLDPATPEYRAASDYAHATMGQSKIAVFRALFPGDEERAHEANRGFERAYAAHVAAGGVRPVSGAVEAIRELRERGIAVALTTGFGVRTREQIVRTLGWEGLCDLRLSPADAGRGRPHPDMVLTALLRLGCDGVQALAVAGDTTSDLWAGHRAGAAIVAGVRTGAQGAGELAAAPHTHILPSVADLPSVVAAHNATVSAPVAAGSGR